jgi:hypothetical protein
MRDFHDQTNLLATINPITFSALYCSKCILA